MAVFRGFIVLVFVPLLGSAAPADNNTSPGGSNITKKIVVACSSGKVCSKGSWAFYFHGKTADQCKATCDDGRKQVPIPDGVTEEEYHFRQNGQFHKVAGGKRTPDFVREVTQINYRGTGGNFPGWNRRDHFYGHWEGKIKIEKAGVYEFFTRSDDGSRMFLDNDQVSDNPGWHGMRWPSGRRRQAVRNVKKSLQAGEHPFWAEMFEGGGGAGMEVYYQGPDTGGRRIIMPASAFSGKISEKVYYFRQNGQYHDVTRDIPPRKPTYTRKVANINYPGTGGHWKGFKARDHFYARWSGYIKITAAGEYTFYTISDDGSQMFVGDKRVVYNPGWHGMRERSGKVALAAGKTAFSAEVFEGGGGAGMILKYSGPDTNNQKIVVPASVLSSSLEGSGQTELNPAWKDVGKCEAYSHKGDDVCIIYTACTELGDDNVCSDNSFDWVEPATFTTCKYNEVVQKI